MLKTPPSTPSVAYLLHLILHPASSSMTLHLYPRSCVILHERTVQGVLRRYEVILNNIIFFPHYVDDTANLLLQWLSSFTSSSNLPPPDACIYIQDPASYVMSLAPPPCRHILSQNSQHYLLYV